MIAKDSRNRELGGAERAKSEYELDRRLSVKRINNQTWENDDFLNHGVIKRGIICPGRSYTINGDVLKINWKTFTKRFIELKRGLLDVVRGDTP